MKNFERLSPEYQSDGELSMAKFKKYIQEAFQNEHKVFEWMHQNLQGELIPSEITLVHIEQGDSHMVTSYIRDLRADKDKEKKLSESVKEECKIEYEIKMGQVASETKAQFLENISHEIRTPMNAIFGISEMLLMQNLEEEQVRQMEDIKISAMSLLNFINDTLDFSRAREGKLNLTHVHYDFPAFLNTLNKIVQYLARDKEIEYQYISPDELPLCLYGDPVKLNQVLFNVLNNAIKYTEEGHVQFSISIDDAEIDFAISDTGMGIRKEDISNIFESFVKVDEQKNHNKPGIGLGLSITKTLVEMMNGKIAVESVYGLGTTFYINIPKILGDETKVSNQEDVRQIFAPNAKVLVVDDNAINLNVVSGLLRLHEVVPDTALSGQQAIEMIRGNQYDLVFMDYLMPEMDGLETMKIIRKMEVAIPIVAISANTVTGMKEMLLSEGMNDFLPKPIKKAELNKVLRNWLPSEKVISKKL